MKKQKKALREIDAPIYNYWQALVLSFFSSRLYVDVGKRWKGFGIRYLLLLIFLVSIPFALRVAFDFNQFFNDQILEPLKQLPPIYIQNGKVSFDKPMPYIIKNKEGKVVSIVDTTGSIKAMNTTIYPDLSILITKDKFFFRLPYPSLFLNTNIEKTESPIYMQQMDENVNQVFDGKTWVSSSGILRVKYISQLLIYPTVAMMFFGMYLVFFLVFALMGQFLAKLFFKLSVTYKQSLRLLVVSSTPQMVVLIVALTLNWLFSGLGPLLIVLLATYFGYAVLSLKRESHKLVIP